MAINPQRARSPGQEGHVVRFGRHAAITISERTSSVWPPVSACRRAAGKEGNCLRCCNMKRAMTLLSIALRPDGIRWYAVCMERAVAYLRVSTQQQQRSGLGIEAQRAAIERFAAAESLLIIEEYAEVDKKAGTANRMLAR